MAPGLIDETPQSVLSLDQSPPKSIFPDGLKTSGQHIPLYEELRPYEDFPEHITGGTVWAADDYKNNPERWTHRLTVEEIAELSDAADHFKAAGIPLTGISQVCEGIRAPVSVFLTGN